MMLRVFRKRGKIFYLIWFMGFIFISASVYYLFLFCDKQDKESVHNNFRLTNEIQMRLAELENGLRENRILLDQVRSKIEQVSKTLSIRVSGNSERKIPYPNMLEECSDSPDGNRFNLTIENLYQLNTFNNTNGGVWKQGWEIAVNTSRWSHNNKLKVFVVPHSHCDPGWIKTFDQYLRDQTRHILNNALRRLSENPDLTFIWAETSFLAAWYETLKSEDSREAVKTLLDNGQLEIVTGGWVMNDEANSHYSAMISQMVDGHEWLKNVLNYRPRYGWAIDPFGLSPTMAFLLKKMGLKGMVIQRVHYSVKKFLAQQQFLEFQWRQYWESSNPESDILCHIEPFFSYDIPHTCGPDPKVCCQFDFKRLPPTRVHCPWKVPPQKITDSNVAIRASMLLEQYRKKSMLYRTNSLLVPLGDDFRYDKLQEWDNQYNNYQKLFDYINAKEEWNTEIKWGTLADYFESFDTSNMPSISGDFFTYADRDDNYWSGFYTTRPFFKRLDRVLESYVRGAEILFSIGCMISEIDSALKEQLSTPLNYARLNLALFQHHDGITGTAKDAVTNDYGLRMINSLHKCQEIITIMSSLLLHLPTNDQNEVQLTMLDIFPNHYSLPIQDQIILNKHQTRRHIVAYNSLGLARQELICIQIPSNITNWIIRDPNGKMVEEVQVNKMWDYKTLRTDFIEACFMTTLGPLSVAQYTIESSTDTNSSYESSATYLYNFADHPQPSPNNIELEMEGIELIFSGADGMLRKVILHQGDFFKSIDLRMKFMVYGTRKGNKKVEKSGAYLFLPDTTEAQDMAYTKPMIRITKGTLISRIEVLVENSLMLRHQITLVRGKSYFDIENEFHMVKGPFDNKELLVRFFSDLQSDNTFYTDLNGLQMVKRKWYDKLPVQGNVYPMPSLVYIEDSWTRLNILSAQPLGVTSRHSGLIDIFLDRRLIQDDNRGVGQGITDHRRTREKFRVVIENKAQEALKPTVNVQRELLILLNQMFIMQSQASSNQGELKYMSTELPCDVHLLNLRTDIRTFNEFYLFLHRFGSSCESQCSHSSNPFILANHLSRNLVNAIQPTISSMSLSLMEEIQNNVNISHHPIKLDQMDFAVFALKLK